MSSVEFENCRIKIQLLLLLTALNVLGGVGLKQTYWKKYPEWQSIPIWLICSLFVTNRPSHALIPLPTFVPLDALGHDRLDSWTRAFTRQVVKNNQVLVTLTWALVLPDRPRARLRPFFWLWQGRCSSLEAAEWAQHAVELLLLTSSFQLKAHGSSSRQPN